MEASICSCKHSSFEDTKELGPHGYLLVLEQKEVSMRCFAWHEQQMSFVVNAMQRFCQEVVFWSNSKVG